MDLAFVPNPACDPWEFAGPDAFVQHIRGCGFYGGVRLLQVTFGRVWCIHCKLAAVVEGTVACSLAAVGRLWIVIVWAMH